MSLSKAAEQMEAAKWLATEVAQSSNRSRCDRIKPHGRKPKPPECNLKNKFSAVDLGGGESEEVVL